MKRDLHKLYKDCASYLDTLGYKDYILENTRSQLRVFTSVGTGLPKRALCLGLGTLSSHREWAEISSTQLYMFKAMLEALKIPPAKAAVHDPAFTEVDRSFIRSFGFSATDNYETALHELICEEPTLIFHPYLPFSVLELVLKQNWGPEYLKNVIFFGTKLDGWLNDHYLKRSLMEERFSSAYIPRLDRCIPLFETRRMEPFPLAKAKGLETSRGKEAILCVIEHMLSFRFQWIPPYRVYAAGERFWRVLKLEDSRWNGEEEEEVEGKKKDEKRKKQRAKAKL